MRELDTALIHKRQVQDKKFQGQKSRVFVALLSRPKTMLMVSVETGILRANICRYIACWRKQDKVQVIKKGICPISKHRACFYTTNPELFNVKTNDQ